MKTIPIRYIRRESSGTPTIAIRGRWGRFKGRKVVRGTGDRTGVRRVVRDIDFNHDGKIDVKGGTIQGRTVSVRGSNRRRAYSREL